VQLFAEGVERDDVGFDLGVGPVRVNLDPVVIGNDQQRRVVQRLGVLLELAQRLLQILVRSLVLPGEMILEPNIGKTRATAGFADAALEGEKVTFRIERLRFGVTNEIAEIEKMRLRGGSLRQIRCAPDCLKFRDVHRYELYGTINEAARPWSGGVHGVRHHVKGVRIEMHRTGSRSYARPRLGSMRDCANCIADASVGSSPPKVISARAYARND
jgi:hypothetical protein